MRLILLGPPGAGKAHASAASGRNNTAWCSSRPATCCVAAVKAGSAGRRCAPRTSWRAGALVPDDVVVAIVADRIDQPDARKGLHPGRLPRTVPQAVALDRMLQGQEASSSTP